MSWLDDTLDAFSTGLKSAGSNALDYLSTPEGILRLGSMGLSYLGNKSGVGEAQIPPSGYQGGIPALTAVRRQAPVARGAELEGGAIRPMGTPAPTGVEALYARQPTGRMMPMAYDPNRRPGSGGRRYFSDTRYVAGDPSAARAESITQSQGLGQLMAQLPSREERRRPPQERPNDGSSIMVNPNVQMARGGGIRGIPMGMAQGGGIRGMYLGGATDGMADRIPATIDNSQPAALSDGEFVVPADVVSGLGNGNSNAGAKQLYSMMDNVRMARTGTKQQGNQINPRKFMPA